MCFCIGSLFCGVVLGGFCSLVIIYMRGFRKFCQRGSKLDKFFSLFLVDDGIEDPNTVIYVPSSARQRHAI